ncbi:hypothetical protein C2G38_2195395 [Gigaspora rosea]|uniref:Nudix hydrolase domain-containing protein n=1 Tax=Gigaspora rosea TaxID=44941 RepID=A0A397V4W5_9GLOM|nr:hypothetical protein C2G38_2195395 [Gigaspora rosea]
MNIKEEVIIEELKEEYFKRTRRKIEEFGYCTIASDRKEIEPEYLKHEELYKKLDYLHSIVINNIGQHLIKRKETYDTVGELNIYNCYSDNHIWNKLTIARSIFKLQEQVYQPYLGHEIGIVAANSLYADIIENIILSIKGDQFHQRIENIENETCILLAQRINPNKDFYLKLNGPGGKAIHEKNENIDVCVIRECFEESEIVLRNEKLFKIHKETYYSTKEWKAEPCLQKEASYIVTLAIYLHPLEESPKYTEPHTLGPWNLYKMEDLLKHRNELVPVLEENIELINGKIKAYEQDILNLSINAQKLEEIKIKIENNHNGLKKLLTF